MHHLRMRKRRHTHLERDAGNAAERLVDIENLFGDGFGVSNDQGSGRTAQGVELRSRGRWPSALFTDLGEGVSVAGEEVVRCLLVGVAEKTYAVQSYSQLLRGVASAAPGLAIQFDVRTKAVWFAADNGNHERKPERAGTREGCRRAPDTEPDGQRVLQGAWVDALSSKRRTVLARPIDLGVFPDLQQQFQLLGKK